MPRRRLTAAKRREAILDAALPLFADCGFETTSVNEIATAAGVAKPVLYDHFGSKQELYVALAEREAAAMFAALADTFDPEAPLQVRLRALSMSAIGFARRHPDSGRLLYRVPTGDAEVCSAHERLRARARETIAAAILADPLFEASPGLERSASAQLLGDLHGALIERLVHWALEHPQDSSDALSQVFVDVLWKGIGAK
jgi:AcrR family transcriptional regulator